MDEKDSAISDQILDLLLDALQERQRARAGGEPPLTPELELETSVLVDENVGEPGEGRGETRSTPVEMEPEVAAETGSPPAEDDGEQVEEGPQIERKPHTVDVAPFPPDTEPFTSVNLDHMLWRLLLTMVVLVVLANVPLNHYGTSLARAMPDSAALIIRDGLLLKGSGEEVYVLQDNKLRWITTLDAFEEYGYRWSQVHQVEDDFLADFEEGLPIHLLLKCRTSPHIYALEDGKKRWIKDIPTFEAQQYVWEDVRFVSCNYLRQLQDGLPIPEDAGPPPQP